MSDRRSAKRLPFTVFFNKFLEGYPYLCRAVDISAGGILCDEFVEPKVRQESFPIELELPGARRSLWVWGRRVRTEGGRTAIRFMALHEGDRAELNRYLALAGA